MPTLEEVEPYALRGVIALACLGIVLARPHSWMSEAAVWIALGSGAWGMIDAYR